MELIPDEEDREFNTGIGNWEGDPYWFTDEYEGHTGTLALDLETLDEEKTATLAYPNIKPKKNIEQWFYFDYAGKCDTRFTAHVQLWLSDGVNSYELFTSFTNETTWVERNEIYVLLGEEWDETEITLYAKVRYANFDPFTFLFDNFSLIYTPTRPDHLPLMGVH